MHSDIRQFLNIWSFYFSKEKNALNSPGKHILMSIFYSLVSNTRHTAIKRRTSKVHNSVNSLSILIMFMPYTFSLLIPRNLIKTYLELAEIWAWKSIPSRIFLEKTRDFIILKILKKGVRQRFWGQADKDIKYDKIKQSYLKS